MLLVLSTANSRAAPGHPAAALVERAAEAVRTDPEASSRDAQAALALIAAQPDVDLEIRARLLLCDHLSERDRPAAQEQIELTRALLPRARRAGLEAGALECQGAIMESAGDNALASEFYDKAVRVAAAANDDEMLATTLFSRGYLLGVQGQYAAGLADLKRARGIFERMRLPTHALTVLNGIATLYSRMGDYAEARRIYTSALKAQREAGMRREELVTLHNLGRAHEKLQEWEQAQRAFAESYTVSHELKYLRGEAYALRGLAAIASAKGDPVGALAILERAALLQQQVPDARLQAQIQLVRGVALHRLNRLAPSAAALNEALQVFEQADSPVESRDTHVELAAVYAQMGNWRAGYEHLAHAQKIAEHLFRNQIDQRFATLKVEFDTAAKEKENTLLVRENEANQKALEQERRARSLQAAVITLTVILAGLLATLAIHQWRSTRRMRQLAMTDELTGVPNRRAVLSQLAPVLESAARRRCAMLIIDIDHFKSINDQYGHAEGDEALKLVASKLRDQVHEPAFIGRLGGEEFVVVLPDTELAASSRMAERFREQVMTIDTSRWLCDRGITVSIGLTLSKSAGDTPSAMLQRADCALYEAKRAGRNCVRVQLPPEDAPAQAADTPQPAGSPGIRYA